AAAGQPKNPRPRDRLPAICKEDCGEDAYFVHDGATSFSLGVADGVGGWTSLGVDPSLFAWDLMNCCREEAEAADARGGVDTAKLLADGYRRVVEEGRVEAGSSTACLMNLDKRTGTVRTTNLGDSGAIFHVPFRTTDLQHYFNAPFQLSVLPPPMRSDPTNIVDSPSDAVSEHFGGEHGIREGDVVVLGTDGVWDNLWEEEIHARLQQAL
ncbi:phosphatase 2C-like domain-containing protein, partial [Hyaloraphidium curvatum]